MKIGVEPEEPEIINPSGPILSIKCRNGGLPLGDWVFLKGKNGEAIAGEQIAEKHVVQPDVIEILRDMPFKAGYFIEIQSDGGLVLQVLELN